MSSMFGAMRKAAIAAVITAAPFVSGVDAAGHDGSCLAGYQDDGSCVTVVRPASLASENLLLQRAAVKAHGASKHRSDEEDTPMVNDEAGFEDGEIEEIEDTSCQAADVRRRRRAETMCSCRRRDSGKRYDGGWVCQNDEMVQEPPKYTNPIWAEEFDDERGDGSLNESRWEILYTGSGNGNNELQFYTKRLDNLRIEDGVLKIMGKPEYFEGKSYTSGKIQTREMGDWGPGVRVEVRAKLPDGVGTWPAIWMMPTEWNYGGWPDSGEIDIMEAVGRSRGKVFGTIHTGAYNHMRGTQKGKSFYTDYTEWHTYALDWHEDRLEWYADGNLYNTFSPSNLYDSAKWPFNRRFYLILNLALGGNLGGPIKFGEEQVMEVDYARVFCLDGSMTCKTEKFTCCSTCPGKQYCSPRSGNCYDEKKQDYYETCEAIPESSCCSTCPGKQYCSPRSGNCYDEKNKDYYETCEAIPEP